MSVRECEFLSLLREDLDMKTQVEKSWLPVDVESSEINSRSAMREPFIAGADDSLSLHRTKNIANAPPGKQSCKTLLIDPNGLLSEALKPILAETPYRPVLSGTGFGEIQYMLEGENSASLLIMDAALDFMMARERVRSLKERNPSIRIVMLVERYDLDQMLAAIQAGAAAYLVKSTSHAALVKTLDLVMLGEEICPVIVFPQLGEMANPASSSKARGLTEREMTILECLTDGASNKLIARRLDVAESTVKVHVKAILRKLKLKNRTQAAMWASNYILPRKRL
jgi:two-component system, NarL family, nitrate/nitrite response regulator NarL